VRLSSVRPHALDSAALAGMPRIASDPPQSWNARVFHTDDDQVEKAERMIRVWGAGLVCLLAMSLTATAKDAAPLALAQGGRVGVINLLDPEVTHFHAARVLTESFLKTHTVSWPIDAMLVDALKERLGQMGLVMVPLGATDALDRGREDCFLNASPAKGMSKECVSPFAQIASTEHVDAIIVLGPGLNNSAHAAGARRKDLPEYLRGWGFVTSGDGGTGRPTLFNMTELLLIGISPEGASLRGREWGGAYASEWSNFTPPTELKGMPAQQLNELQPLFAGLLARQSGRLLDQLRVAP
jgi:hypothetical protein